MGHVKRDFCETDLKDLSGREIEEIAEKAAKKENLRELNRARVSPCPSLEAKIFMMSRLGISANRIAARLNGSMRDGANKTTKTIC